MALPWQQVKSQHQRKSWVEGDNQRSARTISEERIQQVAEFKAEMHAKNVAYQTDREAWEAFKHSHRYAIPDFAGHSMDRAINEIAFKNWQRIWTRESQIVNFEGNGVITSAPAIVTVGDGETRARINLIEALTLEDDEARARIITELDKERERLEKEMASRTVRIRYLAKTRMALENGATAVRNPVTGEWIVQGLLPEPTEETHHGDAE